METLFTKQSQTTKTVVDKSVVTFIVYSIIFLHFSTYLISTRAYDLSNNCIRILVAYNRILLSKYPGIILPAITFNQLLQAANLEYSSGNNLCDPSSPYGPSNCEIPPGEIDPDDGKKARILEELRHFQQVTKYLGASGTPAQPPKGPTVNRYTEKQPAGVQEGSSNNQHANIQRKWVSSNYKEESTRFGNKGASQPQKPLLGYANPHTPGAGNYRQEGITRPHPPSMVGIGNYHQQVDYQQGSNQNRGVFQPVIHTEKHEPHQQEGGMSTYPKYENKQEHHEVGGSMMKKQQNIQQTANLQVSRPDESSADRVGFYLAEGEVRGPVGQEQSGMKSGKISKVVGVKKKEVKTVYEESHSIEGDKKHEPIAKTQTNTGNQGERLEVIEPGGVREVVKGGQKVFISNTNCPDDSELCISIE